MSDTGLQERIGGYLHILHGSSLDDEGFAGSLRANVLYEAEKHCARLYPGKAVSDMEITRFKEVYQSDQRLIMYEVSVTVEE